MAMAMAMARTMMKQQLTKLSWRSSMLKWCYFSTHSDGTKWRRWEGASGGILQDSGRPAYSPAPPAAANDAYDSYGSYYDSDGSDYEYDRRHAYSPPPDPAAANDAYDPYGAANDPYDSYGYYYDSDGRRHPYYSQTTEIDSSVKYVGMGLLRPWSINMESYKSRGYFSPEFYESIDWFRASSGGFTDGTPTPRWWELKFQKPWRLPPGISDDNRPAPQLCNVGSISNWVGRLKRWRLGHTFRSYPNYSVEDVVSRRVCTIAEFFRVPEDPDDLEIDSFEPEQFEYWLDDVEGYYEFMDLAHELHSIDCLFPLLHYVLVRPRAACIRAKTAQLVTTMVYNNPRSQQLVMELHGLQPLWYNFTSDPDATSRTKALGAISALIWNNKPGITAFRETNGYSKLRDALSSENDVRLQRESLRLIQHLLHENSSDCDTVTELGLPHIMRHLAYSDDAEVREAALWGLLVLARDEEGAYKKMRDKEGGNSGQLVKNDDKLKQVLQELIKIISTMAPEDLGAARDEIQLVDSLWNACYNELSSLGEKGLLVFPVEDAPAHNVASKLFEPPLRALAAAEAADRNSVSEKDDNIVTELGLPRIMIHLASNDDAEVREAALRGLLGLARNEGGYNGQVVKNDDKLKQVLQERIERFSAMASEDLGAAREERQLVDSLWNACNYEPPSFGEKGPPAPDVASKQFDPPLRSLAAAETADINSVSEKDCNIVTELGLPCILIHLVSSEDAKVRKAALRGLLVLARDEDGNSCQLVKNVDKLKQVLQKRIEGINAAWEEIHLVDSLWNACYNEPSLLKLFEPSLRAWAAAEAACR